MNLRSYLPLFILVLVLLGVMSVTPYHSLADTSTDVQAQIDDHNAKIKALEDEIAGYQKTLNVLGTQHQTLQSAIKTIDVLAPADDDAVKVTQNKLAATDLTLSQLRRDIATKEDLIQLDRDTVARSIRNVAAASDSSLVEQLFSNDTLTDAWTDIDNTAALNDTLRTQVQVLSRREGELAGKQDAESANRQKLASLQQDLVSQQQQLDAAKAAKDKLLTQTKSSEASYQRPHHPEEGAAEGIRERALEPRGKPEAGGRVEHPACGPGHTRLAVLDTVMNACKGKASALGNNFCITQFFGNTSFATANPQIYNGAGHNAIDIGVPIGTPVQAALSGTVLGTGNTDLVPGCYSFASG